MASVIPSYNFTLTGTTPLLMHHDDVEKADELKRWRTDPANKHRSVGGDDRSPPWTWQTYIYSEDEYLTMPSDNIMVSLRTGGSKVPTGKRQATYKVQSQTGLFISTMNCEFFSRGEPVRTADILDMADLPFAKQKEAARELGFELDVRRARVERKKHVRVRPRFDEWQVKGIIEITDETINRDTLETIFLYAGRAGLCDWRPSSPESPGTRGMYKAKLEST